MPPPLLPDTTMTPALFVFVLIVLLSLLTTYCSYEHMIANH